MTLVHLRLAVCVVGMVAVAGCEAANPTEPAKSADVVSVDPSHQMPPVSKSDAAALEKKPKSSTQTASIATHVAEPDRNKKEEVELSDIGAVGLDETQIRNLLGPPATEVDDAPAKKLRYRIGTCSSEFALYPDVETRVYRILAVEVTSDDGSTKGRRGCVAALRSRIQSAAK